MAEGVDLRRTVNAFSQSRHENGEVGMDRYIEAYDELYRFIGLLGSVFGFVASDVKDKVAILKSHRQSESGAYYVTVNSMAEFEISNNLISKKKNGLPNGCRTLLRLHRALLFLIHLFKGIKDSSSSDSMADITHKAYTSTLAPYHSWLIRKSVAIAVYTLPSRKDFIRRIQMEDEDATMEVLGQLVSSSQQVYDDVQAVYEHHDMLQLP